MKWQPMHTAPTDGTYILLRWPFWSPRRPVIGWFGFKSHGLGIQQWFAAEVLEGDGDPPIGWMPLPSMEEDELTPSASPERKP